jgi:hypothetical protein
MYIVGDLLAGLEPGQKYELLQIKHKNGWTALSIATKYHPEIVGDLLAGLEPRQKYELLQIKHNNGWTALSIATRYHPEIVGDLLAGLEPDQKYELLQIKANDSWTALRIATKYHPKTVADLLAGLESGQKYELLQIKDNYGWTPLMYAVSNHPKIVIVEDLLVGLEPGQKYELLQIKNKYGRTALMYLTKNHPAYLDKIFSGLQRDEVKIRFTNFPVLNCFSPKQLNSHAQLAISLLLHASETDGANDPKCLLFFSRFKFLFQVAYRKNKQALLPLIRDQLSNPNSLFFQVVCTHRIEKKSVKLTKTARYFLNEIKKASFFQRG